MIARLKGPVFGPYKCSNCHMTQPRGNLKSNCLFCGDWFSNYEDILIQEEAERSILNIEEKKNESNIS